MIYRTRGRLLTSLAIKKNNEQVFLLCYHKNLSSHIMKTGYFFDNYIQLCHYDET